MNKYLTLLCLACLCLASRVNAQDNTRNSGMLEPAQWIAYEPVDTIITPLIHAPFAKKVMGQRRVDYKMPVFMREFKAHKNVRRATLWVCGLGQFEVYLDGQKVGNHFLDPGWTLYNKEALYVTFDVTKMLQEPADNFIAEFAHRVKRGEHELRVQLGGGFYNIPMKRYYKLTGSYGQPKLRLRLQIEYTSGPDDNIVTDESWLAGESNITYSSIYGGEDVDLRITPQWKPVINLGYYDGPKLYEQNGTELVIYGAYNPVAKQKIASGDWVYDIGQNMSGIIEVTLQGQKDQEVSFLTAELKNPDGSANHKATGNWQYHVTLNGTQSVTMQPKFSYTGFRYVQVHGAVPEGEPNPEGLPVLKSLIAKHTTSVASTEEAGTFTCNSDYFNSIHRIIDWAIRSNLQSVITDCPHREKLSWLEQDHLMMSSMYYRYDLSNLYRKLMYDMEDSQLAKGQGLGLAEPSTTWLKEGHDLEGMMPTIAPYYTNFGWDFDDSPEWGATFIISPWYNYEWTGKDELFRNHFPAMQRYIEYLTRRARTKGYILDYGLGDWYDLGPKAPGYSQLTSQGVTATAIYYYDVTLMAKMGKVLNQQDKVTYYESLADTIRNAYNAKYLHADSCYYDRNSQCANAMSLYFGLVPEKCKAGVFQHLVDDIEGRIKAIDTNNDSIYEWGANGKTIVTAGDVGYRYVLKVLAENGRNDVIYDMSSRDDVPGYGMQLKKGATALTESWQALENVSNNHLMLGHIMEWLYGYLGGLRQAPGSIGWNDVLIEPHPVGDITDCTVSYKTPKGKITVHWWIEGQKCNIQYTAPKSIHLTVKNPAEELTARYSKNK